MFTLIMDARQIRNAILVPAVGIGLSIAPLSFGELYGQASLTELYRTPHVDGECELENLIPSLEREEVVVAGLETVESPEEQIPQRPISAPATRDTVETSLRHRSIVPIESESAEFRTIETMPPDADSPLDERSAATRHRPTYNDAPASIPQVDPSVVRRVVQLLDDSVDLAGRGAVFSARAQLIKGMRLVSQSLDAEARTQRFSQSLADGLQALDEAKDFAPNGSELEAHLNMRQIIDAHRTKVLKGKPTPTPLAALQMYHAFAEEQLATACGREAIASRTLTALAKLQPLLVSQDSDVSTLAIPRSMSLYQAALIVDSKNYLAANELGVLFARYGQLEDARDVLAHCAEIDPNQPTAWKNLATVHRHLGEHRLAAAATEEWQLASAQSRGQIQRNPQTPAVEWVNPETFSAGSMTAAPAKAASMRSQPRAPTMVSNRSKFDRQQNSDSSQAINDDKGRKQLPELPSSNATPTSWSERFTSLFHNKGDRGAKRR